MAKGIVRRCLEGDHIQSLTRTRSARKSGAAVKDALSKLRMVECAWSMEQRRKQGSFAVVKDALSKLRIVECALSMEQRGSERNIDRLQK
jgi:hypothetical protein